MYRIWPALPVMLMFGLCTVAVAQDEPEGKLHLRGVYSATYTWRSHVLDQDKTGGVATHSDRTEEYWDHIALIFTENTTWKYRDGVPVEMQDDAMVTGSGGGGLRKLSDYVTTINKNGEWAPYHYVVTEDGSWTYSIPTKPKNQAIPPMMAIGGSVVVLPFLGTYSLILNPYPNAHEVTFEGSYTHRKRPKRDPGNLKEDEDQVNPIDEHHLSDQPRARFLVAEAYHKMQELLKPATGIQGTWDVARGGFSTSGHLSERGGPGQKTTRTDPINKGDWKSTGLVIVENSTWTADVSWSFTYDKSPIEAIIKPVGEYKKWVPAAGAKQGKAGNTIGFKVELRDKKTGGKPKDTTATFQFKLIDTSAYPGSCMNSSWTDAEPDMKILKDQNQGLANVDGDGQGATSKAKLTECPITVSCLDGGGHTRLQVIAQLTDAPEVIGHMEEDGTEEIALPFDDNYNKIADAWEDDKGVKGKGGEVDDEQDPPGDRTDGDGLTLWEEYRGFVENGKYIRGNVKKKDYFIADTVGGRVKRGISLFKKTSKLEVHSDLTIEELGVERVINRNHGDGPHVVDQHGIFIGQRETDGTCEAISHIQEPSTPKDIQEVVIDPQVQTTKTVGGKTYDEISSFVAHELLHACNVWHHGQCDETRWWHTETQPDGRKAVYEFTSADDVGHPEKGVRIYPCLENGTELATSNWNVARTIWVGLGGGQHSGCEDCIMRYDCAQAYAVGLMRYYLHGAQTEVPGFGLCLEATGTGVNAAGRAPRARYGDATRGDCADQIRVKDPF